MRFFPILLIAVILSFCAHVASGQEKASDRAERVFMEAVELGKQQTVESLKKAITKYEEAIQLWHSAGDRQLEGLALNNLAQVYYSIGDRKKAVDLFGQALAIMQATGDKRAEATTLSNIAVVYQELGERDKALDSFNKALPLRRAAGDKEGEGVTLSNIGMLYSETGDNQKALEYFNQALAIMLLLGNRNYQEVILNNLAGVYQVLGDIRKSLDNYTQALEIAKESGDRSGESSILNGIGNLYFNQGDNLKALDYYNRSLALSREVGDRAKEAGSLGNVALTYDIEGEKQKALDYYSQALALTRSVGDPRKEAELLSNIGALYNSIDDNEKALEYFDQALPILRSVGDRSGEATTLNNIGAVYDRIGEARKALEYYGQSLALVRAIGERRTEGVLLDNIGAVHESLEDHKTALEYHNKSVMIAREIGDKSTLATALRNVGIALRALGDKAQAIERLNQALENARAVGNPRLIGSALNNLAETSLLSEEKQKALDYYSQSLPLWRSAQDLTGEAGTLYGLARAQRELGNLQESRARIEAALKIVESLRMQFKKRRELRTSYFASVQKYYDFYIDLLMRLSRVEQSEANVAVALQASERARARGLLDMLVEAHADIREGVDPKLLERERVLQQKLSARAEWQMQLLAGKHMPEQVAAAAKEVEAITTEFEAVEAQIRATSPRYAALTQPQPLSLKEIQRRVLDDDTLLLEYSLGEERSYLWVVSKTSLTSYELPKREDVEKSARAVYALLIAPNQQAEGGNPNRGLRVARVASDDRRLEQSVVALSRIVIGPAASQLGAKRLIIVADGALHYVPFAALTANAAGYQPLILDHEIASLPSASALAVMRQELRGRNPAAKTIAVLADPVFDRTDERVKKAGKDKGETSTALSGQRGLSIRVQKAATESGVARAGLLIPRLPGTRQEAERILALTPASERKQAMDFAASKATATSAELGHYRFIHFATHGFLDSLNPELSGIVLSMVDERGAPQNGFLRAHEIYNLKLPADLVVLSACQTGLGKEIRGEGLVGLTRGFLYAGAARVVVSLWSVDDEATSELMSSLYSRTIKDHLPPASALRAAQIEMLKQPKWQAPYYWAAFVLQGEWK